MKKIILAVILMAAAGGIIYYLLQKKKQNSIVTINKELIGKWKIDSLVARNDSTKDGLALLLFALDSNARKQEFDFQNNGIMVASTPGASEKDTSFFIWENKKQIVWKEKNTGSFTDTTSIIKLDKKDLVLLISGGTLFYLKRIE
jgi:hypothetical protein